MKRLLATAGMLCCAAGLAAAQELPAENHYKTYVTAPLALSIPCDLKDEFGTISLTSLTLNKFATPVSKDGSTVYDQTAHQTWWKMVDIPMPREVVAKDQFGTARWLLSGASYLVAPALKNPLPGQGPPVRNHYLCYDALGPVVTRTVTLVDQFGQEQVVVLAGKMLCNPVEKTVGGITYPVVDPTAHLTCYLVENPNPHVFVATARDQFGDHALTLLVNDCLCNPALTGGSLATQSSTWGQIKALYRDQ